MIENLITTGCSLCCLFFTALLSYNIKKQTGHIKTMADAMFAQLYILKFLGKAEASNLWKIRQEIYNWQCQWVEKDEYEAAKQAKIMIEHIEELINIHSNFTNHNENNESTDE